MTRIQGSLPLTLSIRQISTQAYEDASAKIASEERKKVEAREKHAQEKMKQERARLNKLREDHQKQLQREQVN